MRRVRWMVGVVTSICILMVVGVSPTAGSSSGSTITTSPSPSVALGQSVSDTATLTNVVRATGTITFSLYGPNDPTCSGTALFTSTTNVPLGTVTVTSASTTPSVAGVYYWVAHYSGDQFNASAASPCGAESVVITPTGGSPPVIATVASPAVALGGQVTDAATLTGGSNPTGTITFTLFNSAQCSGTPVFTATVNVAGDGSYGSPAFTPTAAGTYYWSAAYGGDRLNSPASSPCGAPNESVTVGGGGAPGQPTAQTGPPKVISSSKAQFTATINPEGRSTTMHFEYAVVLPGASVAAITYDSSTPEQPVGSDFANHTVTAAVAGLLPNSTYHVRAVAANAAGVTPGADATFRTATDPPPPAPVLGKAVNARPISGIVYVLIPGQGHVAVAPLAAAKGVGFIPLTEARQLPVGTVFDTSHGVARLTTATAKRGVVQVGDFAAGLFRVLQSRRERGLTELALVLGSGTAKTCAPAAKKARAAARRALPRSVLGLLRASGKGRFRTRGRFSSATVRGTIWTTTDRCDGTLTSVKRGVVVVTDFRRRRQVVVRAGRSYLAKAP